MPVLLIDNYDSFTYNIVHALWDVGLDVLVYKHDEITLTQALDLNPEAIVIGPGPGTPQEAGISLELIRKAASENIPLLGICLGMQAIGEAFGGHVIRANKPIHGKLSLIKHNGQGLFKGLPQEFKVTRYHSLVVEENTLPSNLFATAKTEAGEIMALKHSAYCIEGVQFHPEAIATEYGAKMFMNWTHSWRSK